VPFLPLLDRNPRVYLRYPWVTWSLIGLCVLVFLLQAEAAPPAGDAMVYSFGFIPALLSGAATLSPDLVVVPAWATTVTALFLHGDMMHLLGNMLFLWVFGDNVEDSLGHLRFLAFYLACGIVACLAQFALDPASPVPTIGASGAISGVLGAYLLLHPQAKVLVPIVFFPVYLPAWLLLIVWLAFQFVGLGQPQDPGSASIAWLAHIGGFAAGLVLVVFLKRPTVALFGGLSPPRGIAMREPPQRPARDHRRRRGPWG